MKKNRQNSKHYHWGEACSGWHLAQSETLHIIEEMMPPKTAEKLHYHAVAEQFFYILEGKAVFEIEDSSVEVDAHEGIFIKAQIKHCIKNESDENLEFLVISQPTTRDDRIDAPFSKKNALNLNGKRFAALHNSDNGEVGSGTVFSYHQKGGIVWATYEGGSIKFGTLSGKIEENRLEFHYQHQNIAGEFLTGKCTSEAQVVKGKIRLLETWQWTCRDFSMGDSVLEEL